MRAQELGNVVVTAELGPARGVAVVEGVADRRVGAELEERFDGLRLAGLCGEMEGGHALAVVGPAEGPTRVYVRAELDEAADRRDASVHRRPSQRRAAVRVGIEVGAEVDEPLDRFNAVALRRPHERLVDDLLRIIGRLPGRKAAVRAVETAVRAGRGRAGELVDQVDEPEPGGNAQVARLEPEQVDDLAVAPEERDDQRRAAVTPRGEVSASAGRDQELGERVVVP